jgi:hypothetical protein
MVEERFSEIIGITQNIPNRMRESYIRENRPDTYLKITEFCSNIPELPFVQKIWHWVHDRPEPVLCRCGSNLKFHRKWTDGYRKGCSPKCSQSEDSTKEKRKKTNLEKWGVENISRNPDVKKKIRMTNLDRYGTTSTFQNEDVRNKWKETIESKYGTSEYFTTQDFKDKSKKTNLERYGKESFTSTDEYREKAKKTNMERYGKEWYVQTEEHKIKTIGTNLERFGKEWFSQTDGFKELISSTIAERLEKSKATNLERYGVEFYTQSADYKSKKKKSDPNTEAMKSTNLLRYGKEWYTQTEEYKTESKKAFLGKYGTESFFGSQFFRNNFLEKSHEASKKALFEKAKRNFEKTGMELVGSDGDILSIVGSCGHLFEIRNDLFYHRKSADIQTCTVCNPINSRSSSHKEVEEWLESFGIRFETNNRTVCKPMEIDIFIPDMKIGMEFNGLYWHSEIHKDSIHYHRNKSDMAKSNGIDLIHIWEDDWKFKNKIVKSVLKNRLNLIKDRIFARKCEIKTVETRTKIDFLNRNHIQGNCSTQINLGMYCQDRLVSLMCFNKKKDGYELSRFCNLIDLNVVGSGSKLFSHFLKNWECSQITSFSDISIFNGGVYEKLGFEKIHSTNPNYWWVIDGIRKHKSNFRKEKLSKKGFDITKTESQIMSERGFYRVWGCGLIKWEWKKK